jgi:hypothetical protein
VELQLYIVRPPSLGWLQLVVRHLPGWDHTHTVRLLNMFTQQCTSESRKIVLEASKVKGGGGRGDENLITLIRTNRIKQFDSDPPSFFIFLPLLPFSGRKMFGSFVLLAAGIVVAGSTSSTINVIVDLSNTHWASDLLFGVFFEEVRSRRSRHYLHQITETSRSPIFGYTRNISSSDEHL